MTSVNALNTYAGPADPVSCLLPDGDIRSFPPSDRDIPSFPPSDIGFTRPGSTEQSDGDGQTAVLDKPEEKSDARTDDGGDADRYAHYVSAKEMARSRATGRPVVALCGKVWVPKHNPADYPICPECRKIYEQMTGGNN